jgi:hypothetical protein
MAQERIGFITAGSPTAAIAGNKSDVQSTEAPLGVAMPISLARDRVRFLFTAISREYSEGKAT